MAIEESSQGEFLAKAIETPKVSRTQWNNQDVIEFEAWVSTEAMDRDGEIIRMDGWRKPSLGKVKLLLFHDYYELAIGKPYWTVKKEADGKKGLYTKGRFGPQMHGMAVGELYLQGDMDAFSVAFNWYKRTFDSEADGIKTPYFEYLDQELYEYSAVNIPANPEATIAMERMLADAGDIKDAMAIIKSFNNQKTDRKQRDSYIIKKSDLLEKAIASFADTNKRMIDFMAKYEKHADVINASDFDDADDIDLDELLGSGDALGEDGDISESDLAEMLVGTGDDAEIDNLLNEL